MHQLVAQGIEAHKHLVEHALGVLLRQGTVDALARFFKRLAPVLRNAAVAARVVHRVPKGLEHVLVVQQNAHRAGKHLPHQFQKRPALARGSDGVIRSVYISPQSIIVTLFLLNARELIHYLFKLTHKISWAILQFIKSIIGATLPIIVGN